MLKSYLFQCDCDKYPQIQVQLIRMNSKEEWNTNPKSNTKYPRYPEITKLQRNMMTTTATLGQIPDPRSMYCCVLPIWSGIWDLGRNIIVIEVRGRNPLLLIEVCLGICCNDDCVEDGVSTKEISIISCGSTLKRQQTYLTIKSNLIFLQQQKQTSNSTVQLIAKQQCHAKKINNIIFLDLPEMFYMVMPWIREVFLLIFTKEECARSAKFVTV